MISIGILVFSISIVLSTVLIKAVINYAYKRNLFDKQNNRKIHKGNIPRLGGVAFVPAAIITYFFSVLLTRDEWSGNAANFTLYFGVFLSMFIIYLFGVIDDVNGLRYRTKFIYQFVVGIILCVTGLYIKDMGGVLGLLQIPFTFGSAFSIFLLILIINAFNFIDGIDGLSSSIAILSLIYYSIIFYLNNSYLVFLSIAFVGAILPFFYFNVFGKEDKKNKTFMGDTGSTVLGLLLFVLAVSVNEDVNTSLLHDSRFVLAFAPLALPCYDVFSVVVHRLLKGNNPFKADKNHFHHKLLKIGLGQHLALVVELLAIIFLSATIIIMSKYINVNIVIVVTLGIWVIINLFLDKLINNN